VSRALQAAALAMVAILVALVIAAWAVHGGLVPDDTVRLWARANSAGSGSVAIGHIVAAYPAVPFLTTTLVSLLTPDGTPAPALVAAGLLGLLTALWFSALRSVGLPPLAAAPATLLIALHPALLRAVIGGPADMFLALFIFLVGRAFYALRARTETTEVMAVGTALLGLAFSHPLGAAIAIAAMPFLGLTVRPALAASAPFSVVTALLFPTVFAAAAFVYVSWVFPGSGWSFYQAPAESLAAWSAGVARTFGEGLTGVLALDTTLAVLLALLLGAPLAVVATYWARERRPLVAPALVFIACIATAAAVTVATRLFGAPTAVTVAAPALAAVVMTRVPLAAAREHRASVLALLAAGWIGGAAGLLIIDPAITAPLLPTVDPNGDRERRDALFLGGVTIDHDGVLVDSDNAPAVVLGRHRARGLLGPLDEAFALTLLFGRIQSPFVAVPDPESITGMNDRLNIAFPGLYREGAPGYHLIYQNNTWRLFARLSPEGVYGH
jgi:membrane protein XagC